MPVYIVQKDGWWINPESLILCGKRGCLAAEHILSYIFIPHDVCTYILFLPESVPDCLETNDQALPGLIDCSKLLMLW